MEHGRRPPAAALRTAVLVTLVLAAGSIGPAPASATVLVPFTVAGSEPLGPGTVHTWGSLTTDAGPSVANIVRVDPAAPNVHLESLVSNDTVAGLETVSSMASRESTPGHRVVAAVNGDFWSGYGGVLAAPNGTQIHGGELVTARRGSRPLIGVDAAGVIRMDDVTETMTLDVGGGLVVPITRFNQARNEYETALFSPRFGTSTGTDATGTEVVLSGVPGPIAPSGTYVATVQSIGIGVGDTALAPGTLVLSRAGTDSYLNALVPGQSVTIATAITPGWEGVTEAIGGGEWILRGGVVGVNPPWSGAGTANARTAVGITADGKLLIATVDGQLPGYSAGIDLTDLAGLLQGQGAVSAINFDGGGSTTLVARRPGDAMAGLVNRPSDGAPRAVTNALAVVSTAPDGPIAGLAIRPAPASVAVGSATTFSAVGWDTAINAVPVPPSSVGWSASGGTIDPSGRFLAATPGPAMIQAVALGLSASATFPVVVATDTTPPIAGPPIASFVTGWMAGQTAIAVQLAWPAATDVGSGVAAYHVWMSANGAAYTAVPLFGPLVRSAVVRVAPGPTYRFAVDAMDGAGNVSPKAVGPRITQTVVQEGSSTVAYRGRWARFTAAGYYGGAVRAATTGGTSVTIRFSGSDVAWVSSIGPDRGAALVFVDGRLAATIDLRAAKSAARRVVFRTGWATVGRHVLEIRPRATAGRPRVDVDAFLIEVTRPAP
ncbi:MAG: phosphodiester glycosidase family protein [Chloroflexi bacterium]|nr:phosphodiester glycosidase family protein [Chloroflexota bacterium]